jgi:alpha-ketoglutarate-dependent taurine dioxygenase
MSISVQPCDSTLGALVTGIDLNHLSDQQWQTVEKAWLEHAVLIFPMQDISEAQHVALGQRIGPIEILSADRKAVPISNQKPDGGLLGPDSSYYQILRGNEGWHTDSSYMPVSARASILAAQILPDAGGETQWADMRAAYQALSEKKRQQIDGLAAFHSLYHSQAKIGHKADIGSSYGLGDQPPPLRPLVKLHPDTQAPSLYIGRHAYGIPGLSEAESEALLAELVEFACQAPRVVTHSWAPGDVVMWDNRCVLHRARPYDYSEPRVMRHVRVTGDPAFESGVAQ